MTDTAVTLGSVQFKDFEVPDRIPFGGEQRTAIHRFLGDKRQIDVLGRSDEPLKWSGIFLGEDALDRARFLDSLRIAGAPLDLTWSELSYSVIITRFVADFAKSNYLPYSIECEVIEDTASPPSGASDPTTDDMVTGDMTTSSGLVGQIGDTGLTGLFGTLQTAVSKVSSIAAATQEQLGSMLAPLTAVQGQVSDLLDTAGAGISDLAGFGGVQIGVPGEQSAAALMDATVSMLSLDPLNQLQSYLGRIQTNLSAVGASGAELPTAGGDLYTIATEAYGDPSGWTTIARANGLTDPVLTGPQTLRVPPVIQATDGVLSV